MDKRSKTVHIPHADLARQIVSSAGVTPTGDLQQPADRLVLVVAHQFLLPYQPCASTAQYPTGECLDDCPFNGYVIHREICNFLGITVIDHSLPNPGF